MVRDISGLGSPPSTDTGAAQRRSSANGNAPQPEQAAVSQTLAQDDVELSSQGKRLNALAEKVGALPDVDESRVAQIKAAIERNEFTIDDQRLADKILAADDFFNS